MKLIFCCIITFLYSSCTSKKPINHPISGSEVSINRDALIYYVGENRKFLSEYPYDLYDKDNSNSWRKEGWLKTGEKLNISQVAIYLTDAMGEWVGVTGSFYDSKNKKN